MKVDNIYSNVNIKGLNNIKQDPSEYYLRHHKEIIVLKNKYESFNTLMNHNKSLKLKDRLSIREIENITTLSKSSYYRIHNEIIKKGNSYWTNYYKKNSTKPINFRKSKIIDYYNINSITRPLIDIIREIRNNNPTYSKYKINAILKRDYKDLLHKTIEVLNEDKEKEDNCKTSKTIINSTTLSTLKEEKRKKIVIGLSTLGRILKFLKTNSLTKNYHHSKRDYNNNQRNKKTRSRGLMFTSNHQRSVRPKFAGT